MLLAFNKPFGVTCKFSPEPGKRTLADYIDVRGVYPAGRLDTDSEGLLLLTDDGVLQTRIAEPRHKKCSNQRGGQHHHTDSLAKYTFVHFPSFKVQRSKFKVS